MMIKLKDILNETKSGVKGLINESTVENETNLNFKVVGIRKNDLIIEGKKMKLTLSFKGDDLKDAVNGKSKGGKVVFVSVKIK